MSPQEQINLNRIGKLNVIVSLSSLVVAVGVLAVTVRAATRLEGYLNQVVTIEDVRQWERANAKSIPPLVFPVSMDDIHSLNHDTTPRFK